MPKHAAAWSMYCSQDNLYIHRFLYSVEANKPVGTIVLQNVTA